MTVLPRVDVPCGSCRLCCRISAVFLREDEYADYDWSWCVRTGADGQNRAIGRVLTRKPNGDCVYLSDSGCSIHDHAPKTCREFDCRTLFLRSDRSGRRLAIKNGEVSRELFDKGREMVKLSETDQMAPYIPAEEPREVKLLNENARLRKIIAEALGALLADGNKSEAQKLQIMLDAIDQKGQDW